MDAESPRFLAPILYNVSTSSVNSPPQNIDDGHCVKIPRRSKGTAGKFNGVLEELLKSLLTSVRIHRTRSRRAHHLAS